jgi:hypothetical protein
MRRQGAVVGTFLRAQAEPALSMRHTSSGFRRLAPTMVYGIAPTDTKEGCHVSAQGRGNEGEGVDPDQARVDGRHYKS